MRSIIPYERWTLRSPLSPSEVMTRLEALVARPAWRWPWQRCDRPFQGSLDGRRFRVMRTIRGHNSFLPVIVGEVRDDLAGSRLEITFRLHKSVVAVLALFGVGLATGFFGGRPSLVPLLVLAAFMLLLSAIGFAPEAEKAKVLLAEALSHSGSGPAPPSSV